MAGAKGGCLDGGVLRGVVWMGVCLMPFTHCGWEQRWEGAVARNGEFGMRG
jgi:hypothetical protein